MSARAQLVLALIFSGGGTSALVYFKEGLPLPLFSLIIWLIWISFIVSLVRFLFGDQISKWYTERKRYRMRVKTAERLLDKWMELEELISGLVNNGWKINKKHQDKYSSLHVWFNNNRCGFLPLWTSFIINRPYAANEGDHCSASLHQKVFHGEYYDFFSYFYMPQDVKELEEILKHQRNADINNVLANLRDVTSEFVEWVKLR